MTNKTEQVSVPRELANAIYDLLACPQHHVRADYIAAYKLLHEILAAPPEDVRAVLPTQSRLLPNHTALPHPPRHWGFFQPGRKVPGYTLEQMKEYGAQCAAEALRQNK
jgi:hypothetical protein